MSGGESPLNVGTMIQISLRLSEREKEHLEQFWKLTDRTQNDVIRELLRKLSIDGALNPIN